MFRKALLGIACATAAMTASAVDVSNFENSLPLQDDSIVYVFKDGKMGMENKYGRVESMKAGHVMETKCGQKIVMIGNEVARLE